MAGARRPFRRSPAARRAATRPPRHPPDETIPSSPRSSREAVKPAAMPGRDSTWRRRRTRDYALPLMSQSSGFERSLIAASGCLCAIACLEVAIRVATAWKRVDLASIAKRPVRANGADLVLGDIIRPNPNDRIVYELRPGFRGRFLGQDLAINSLGMRSPERPLAKRRGTFRVVGIGDSVMFGWGVAAAETYLSILERDLEARFAGRRFEVWNLAVPGYNSVQEVESFAEKVDRLEPDLVIVGWVGNDMDLPNFLAEPPDPWSLRRFFLLDLVESRVGVPGGREGSSGLFEVPADPGTKRLAMPPDDIPPRYRPLVGWDNMA